jgi:hypothetical protein
MQRRAVGNQEMVPMPDYDDVASVGSGQDLVGKNVARAALRHHAVIEANNPGQM